MNVTSELTVVACWCGVVYAIPDPLDREASKTGQQVYCPLGHTWVRNGSELDRLRKQVAGLQDARERLIRQRDAETRSHSATKGQLTKARKRAAATMCPCCHRSFQPTSMARHIATKHPEFTP
jgi:hypothetical protein